MGIPAPEQRLSAFPHLLSGGMNQRVMIAMAIACNPRLLIADEPTTALDVTIQKQILELLEDLQRDRGMALILITHDMAVVADTGAARAGDVCRAGDGIASDGSAAGTRRHIRTRPRCWMRCPIGRTSSGGWRRFRGSCRAIGDRPRGCLFAPRCRFVFDRCVERPDLRPIDDGAVRCHAPL